MASATSTTASDDGPTGVAARAGPLWTVQLLRAAAALMVVIGHSQSAVSTIAREAGGSFERSALLPWGAGVDLFFVISGFIMVHASAKLFGQPGAAGAFLARRLARIVPLYWLVTSLFLLLLVAASIKGGDVFPSPLAILASYAFVPFDTWGRRSAFPIFDLGWTLNYEMFFYFLFAVTVGLPRRRAVAALGLLLLLLVVAGAWVPDGATALLFWTRPVMLDFGLGIAVGLALAEGVRLPGGVRLVLAIGGIALLAADPTHIFNGPVGTTVSNGWPRVGWAGLPAAAALAGGVLGREPRLASFAQPFAVIGDASYSLYLLHPVALILLEKLAQKLAIVAHAPPMLLVIATVAFALLIALIAFRWLEMPLTRAARRLVGRKPGRREPLIHDERASR